MKRVEFALVVLLSIPTVTFSYTKPVTYNETFDAIVFKDKYMLSPHSWAIQKAIDLLEADGFKTEAALARKYRLPMFEGVTFNDVWGDADIAGGSVLDYWVPDPEGTDTHHGFGCAISGLVNVFGYKNCTDSFKSHPFYRYENAGEEAQYRYDYARRIYLGQWNDHTDDRDTMAGWVIDNVGIFDSGQDDPQDGRWASGAASIEAATAPDGTRSRFGRNTAPADALLELFQNHTNQQIVFPQQSDPALSTIFVPTKEVFDQAPEWLDERFHDADDVEAYNGYDGRGYAVYANWTLDAKQHCNGGSDCAAPMVVRLESGSKAHAFFQLGWAIHLLEDNTTPVHTTSDSLTAFESHNDVESIADAVLDSRITVTAGVVVNLLPALGDTYDDPSAGLKRLIDYPPVVVSDNTDCLAYALDPATFYKRRWYVENLTPPAGEGVAHAYTRIAAEAMHGFMPYISCIDTEDNRNWAGMGFFTGLGLDMEVKVVAGLIRQFIEDIDKTAPAVTIVQPAAASYPHSGTLVLAYSATDDESGVKTVKATLDGKTTVGVPPHGLASGQVINLLTDVTLGDHTFQVKATDNAGNVAAPFVMFSVVVTPASIIDDVTYFLSTGAITSQNEANSLLKKLQAAAAQRAAGKCNDAAPYQAFINELYSQSGKSVAPDAVAIMVADAEYLMSHCP